jgi:hypothetical protein
MPARRLPKELRGFQPGCFKTETEKVRTGTATLLVWPRLELYGRAMANTRKYLKYAALL